VKGGNGFRSRRESGALTVGLFMETTSLTGAQKTRLRGLGQTLEASLKLGKAGLGPAFFTELNRLLDTRELVKLRFEGSDRHERARLVTEIEAATGAPCVGAVGHTALFYRQQPEPTRRKVQV
jgi:RNA-binding protein